LVNLIDNVKFSFRSEIIVRVHFELDKLQISVSDKGIGFDQSSDEYLKIHNDGKMELKRNFNRNWLVSLQANN
jgi:anti-sigma regulatory factor (Ser/Thr protein kinase)